MRWGADVPRALLPASAPERGLFLATLVNTLGNGIFLTGGAIFLTRGAGLAAHTVGAGLAAAGIVALASGVVIGDWADRYGARRVLMLSLLLEAAASAGLAATGGVALFLISATIAAIGRQGSVSAQNALIALIGGPDGRVALRARQRAVTNLGISGGALVGGVGLAVDTHAGYVAMIAGDALTFLLAALLVARLPRYAPTRTAAPARGSAERRWLALTDRPYLAVTALNAVQAINYTVLTVGIPLWVSQRTDAPRWIVAPLMLINTFAVVALQVRATRGVADANGAALALRRAGVAFLLAWTVVGLAADVPAAAAVALLVGGVAIHTAGELWQAASQFELSFSLARAEAQGQYQGVFGLGQATANALAPAIVTGVCVAGGEAGWIAVGAALALAGTAAPATIAWAQRRQFAAAV